MADAIIQRRQSRLIEKLNSRTNNQEIVVYSMIGAPLINSSKYIVPVIIPPNTPSVRVTTKDNEYEGFLIKGDPSEGGPITIDMDNQANTIMTFKEYSRVEYLSNPNALTIRADSMFTSENADTTFSYITSDLHWDPLIYHFIKNNVIESIVMGKVVSKLPFEIDGATLIADSYPSYYPRGVQMRAMSSSQSSSSSSDETGGIEGNWISYNTDSVIKEGTTIVPLKYKKSTQGLNEPIPSKFSFRHLLKLNPGITRADKEISFLSPFETPSGEHIFVTIDGLTLQSNKEEYRKGQRLIQSLGQTAEVRANTNIFVENVPVGSSGSSGSSGPRTGTVSGDKMIEVVEIKSEIDVDLKTLVALEYFIDSRKYEIVKTEGINDLKISVNNGFLTFAKQMNPGSYKFSAVIRLL